MRTEKDERKLSVYLPRPILRELNALAEQLDRSKSWVLQKAWELARQDMKKFQGPYPEELVDRFKNISRRYSQATRGMSEEEIESTAVKAVRKIRKKQ
ncbi:MAG: ribbon-helix-helix protein, CopG family [Deltaproteobacteria bacterium]|nr:ribbon-helix-helix protein, CopG family [Deltaproteobacteria bacterium]